jgi:putative sterol carrier protein
MSDSATTFFEDIGQRGPDPLLHKADGTVRFDLTNGKKTQHWLVAFDKGDVSTSRRNVKADCVFQTDHAEFERIVRGEANPVAAILRGAAGIEGDLGLLTLFQRLLPDPVRPNEGPRHGTAGSRS